jgi:hypothetical protein
MHLFVFFHFFHSLPEASVCASYYRFYFRGSPANPGISFDPENWTHSTSPISRSTTVQNEGSPSTSLFDSHRHHLPQYRLASLHRPSNFIPRQSLLPL